MTVRSAPISRAELLRRAGAGIGREGIFKPELRPIEVRGVPCLAKDYGRRPFLVRETLGRASISREAAVYDALRGLPGVPRFFGRVDAYALLIERIAGPDAKSPPPEGFPAGYFDSLREIVRGLHRRGIVHGDLRQRRNILIGPGGRPYVVDFASGIRLPPASGFLAFLSRADLSGVAKLRARHAPETITPEDERLLTFHRFRFPRRRG